MSLTVRGTRCALIAALMSLGAAGCWETPTGQLRSQPRTQTDNHAYDREEAISQSGEGQSNGSSTSGNGRGGDHKVEKH